MESQTKQVVLAGRAELIPETQNMVTLAKYLHESKMFPSAGGVAGIMTIMEYGRELGIPPVAALRTMAVIHGRLTMEAKAMLAVAQRNANISWKIDKLDNDVCTMTFMRDGFAPCVVSFTAVEAKEAGLLGKDNWKLYRQDMLFARCASRGVRRIAPDAVLGLYSMEEMRDVDGTAKKDMEGGARPAPPVKEEPSAKIVDAEAVPAVSEPAEEEPYVGDSDTSDRAGDDGKIPFDDEPEKEPEKEGPDDVLEGAVEAIKQALIQEKIDPKAFKEWLVKMGAKMNRRFVGKIGKSVSLHKGSRDDVMYLITMMPKAVALFKAEAAK